ncbi:hypothetical protein [Micromonospora sp. NPDC005299]|uniref:hypothetical protein n=1 Tax=Micromonospora sp. NPDC005299 TaxID=3364231 RepID=UPI00369AE104
MRKPELVDALIRALREGTERSGPGHERGRSAGSRSATRRQPATAEPTELAELERRAADLADVATQAPEVEEVERRAAELEAPGTEATELPALPAAPARPDGDTGATAPALPAASTPAPGAGADGGTVPRQRSGAHVGVRGAGGPQPVRVADESRSGKTLTIDRADRVVAAMVPPQVDTVDEVVTPEGTMITGGAGSAAESVDTPPLPATGRPRSPAGRD